MTDLFHRPLIGAQTARILPNLLEPFGKLDLTLA